MPGHEEYAEQIADYAAERLSEADRRRLEDHLAACVECSEVASTWKRLGPAIRKDGERLLSPHPDVKSLADYALGAGRAANLQIARHLASCASCELEVSGWRLKQAGERARPKGAAALAAGGAPYRTRIGALFASRHVLSLAAGLAIGVGLAVTLMPPPPPPALAPEAGAPEAGAPAAALQWGGPAQMLVLGQLRGGAGAATLRVAAEPAYVVLALQPIVPDEAPGDEKYRCRLIGPTGAASWSAETTAQRVRVELERSDMVAFAVPAGVLQAGRHRMICGPATPSPDQAPALDIPFDVVR
jgi:hypothetical protein